MPGEWGRSSHAVPTAGEFIQIVWVMPPPTARGRSSYIEHPERGDSSIFTRQRRHAPPQNCVASDPLRLSRAFSKTKMMIIGLIQLAVFLTPSVLAYSLPVYGTKRYGRTNQQYQNPSAAYDPYSSYQIVPISYYKNPYPDSSYYTYPLPYYYPKAYHPLPYYYQDRNGYSYYDYSEPNEDYAQEPADSYYEDGGVEDVNAAFLNNLILAQMYRDSVTDKIDSYDDYDEAFAKIGELSRKPAQPPVDETVRELKQLQKGRGNAHWAQLGDDDSVGRQQRKSKQRKPKKETDKAKAKRAGLETNELYSERKPVVVTTVKPSSDEEVAGKGQKEQFEVRPATPVRQAFSNQVMDMMARNEQDRKRSPSVYDTIKRLLDMEKSLEKNREKVEMRPVMKKRIITPEESLTRQLSVLKKAQ